jgi:hypothetical protein
VGLLKDIIMPGLSKARKKDDGPVRSTSASGGGGGIDDKRRKSDGSGTYIGDDAAAGSYKRGGKVKRTGLARVHKGERVLTRAQAKRYKRRGSGKR